MSDRFLLDTNVISEFNRTGKPDENVRRWLDAAPPDSLYVSVITLAEIQFGIELLQPGKRREHLEQWMEREFVSWFAANCSRSMAISSGDGQYFRPSVKGKDGRSPSLTA